MFKDDRSDIFQGTIFVGLLKLMGSKAVPAKQQSSLHVSIFHRSNLPDAALNRYSILLIHRIQLHPTSIYFQSSKTTWQNYDFPRLQKLRYWQPSILQTSVRNFIRPRSCDHSVDSSNIETRERTTSTNYLKRPPFVFFAIEKNIWSPNLNQIPRFNGRLRKKPKRKRIHIDIYLSFDIFNSTLKITDRLN